MIIKKEGAPLEKLNLQLHAIDIPVPDPDPEVGTTEYYFTFPYSYFRTNGYTDGSSVTISVVYFYIDRNDIIQTFMGSPQQFSFMFRSEFPATWPRPTQISRAKFAMQNYSANPSTIIVPSSMNAKKFYAIARVVIPNYLGQGQRNQNFQTTLLGALGFQDISTSSTKYDYLLAEVDGVDNIREDIFTEGCILDFDKMLITDGIDSSSGGSSEIPDPDGLDPVSGFSTSGTPNDINIPVAVGLRMYSTFGTLDDLENKALYLQTDINQGTSYPNWFKEFTVAGSNYVTLNQPEDPYGGYDPANVPATLMTIFESQYITIPWNKVNESPISITAYGSFISGDPDLKPENAKPENGVSQPSDVESVRDSSLFFAIDQASDYRPPGAGSFIKSYFDITPQQITGWNTALFPDEAERTFYIPIVNLFPSITPAVNSTRNLRFYRGIKLVDSYTNQGILNLPKTYTSLLSLQLGSSNKRTIAENLLLNKGTLENFISGNNTEANFIISSWNRNTEIWGAFALYLPLTLTGELDFTGVSTWKNFTGKSSVNFNTVLKNPNGLGPTWISIVKRVEQFMGRIQLKSDFLTSTFKKIPETATAKFIWYDNSGETPVNVFSAEIVGFSSTTFETPFYVPIPSVEGQTLSVEVTGDGATAKLPIDMSALLTAAASGTNYVPENPAPVAPPDTYSVVLVDQTTRQTNRIQTYTGLDSKALIEAVGFTPVPVAIKPSTLTEELYAVGQSDLTAVSHLGTPFICKYKGTKYRVLKRLESTKPQYRIVLTKGVGYVMEAVYSEVTHTDNFTGYLDTSFVINVTPAEGYNVTNISVNGTTVANGASVTITGEMVVTATAEIRNCLLTVAQVEGGTITINGEIIVSKVYPYWTEITVNLTANKGYEIGNAEITDGIQSYTVTVTQPSNGTITVGTNTESFLTNEGLSYEVNVIANEGYRVNAVYNNGVAITNGSTITVMGNTEITADIVADTAQIIITQVEHATITVDTDKTTTFSATIGTTHTVTITADEGYNVTSLLVNNVAVASGSTFTLNGETTITAVVAIMRLNLSVTQPANGSIKINGTVLATGTHTFDYGTSITALAEANSGYEVEYLDVSDT